MDDIIITFIPCADLISVDFNETITLVIMIIKSSMGLNRKAMITHSVGGRIGRFLEPVFKPFGFDCKIVVATILGIAIKEVIKEFVKNIIIYLGELQYCYLLILKTSKI